MAGRIPQGFILDLLARVDIVEVVGRSVNLRKGGQNFLGLCPFHDEKTPSFTVSPSKQFFHCFGCGAHGSAVGFLMDHRGLSYVDAIEDLAKSVGMTVPREGARPGESAAGSDRGLVQALEQAAAFYRQELKAAPEAIEYLKGRGLAGATAARFGLGYSPADWQGLRRAFPDYADARLEHAGLVITGEENRRYDRFRGRIMFPIRNRRGAVIGFGARVLDGSEPKYLNSPETALFHKGQELYGLFEAQEEIRRRSRVIVCEGYMDVISLSQAGFPESVAALGTSITPEHVATLLRVSPHVVFAFDGDAAGRKAARRALEATLPVIGDDRRASFLLLPQGEDPDSIVREHGAAALEDELSRALSLSQWLLRSLSEGLDLAEPEGRASLLNAARPLLQSMNPGALRMQIVRAVAEAGRASTQDLEQLFGITPWRRLPQAGPGRAPGAPRERLRVEGLKQQLLQRLLAFPALARECNAQIAALAVDGNELVDRQIAEVWRAATASDSTHSGAVIEALAESEWAPLYRSLAARELEGEDDPEAAMRLALEDLVSGFAALEEERVAAEMGALARGSMGPAEQERYRELSARRGALRQTRKGGSGDDWK